MTASEFYFCLHNGSIREEDECLTLITFCPINYWDDKECLPDYCFGEEIDGYLVPGFTCYGFSEETQWCSGKSEDDIRKFLKELGFVENFAMQMFLADCWA